MSDAANAINAMISGNPAAVPPPAPKPPPAQSASSINDMLSQPSTAVASIPTSAGAPASVPNTSEADSINSILDSHHAPQTMAAPAKAEKSASEDPENHNEPWYSKTWDYLNKPLYDAHQWGTRTGAGTIEKGFESGVEDLVSGISSPLSLGLLIGSLGTSAGMEALGITANEIPLVVKGTKALVDAGFTGQQVVSMVKQFPQIMDSLKDGDYENATRLATTFAASGALATLGTHGLAKDAGHLMDDIKGGVKPSEQLAMSKKLAGQYDADVSEAGGRATNLEKGLNDRLKALGIHDDEVRQGAIRKYMLANGDAKLLQDQHDALAGSLKPRPETPEETATRKQGLEFKAWNKGNKLVDEKDQPITAYHGSMSPIPVEDWEAGRPIDEETGQERVMGSGDPNSYLGPHFAIGADAQKVATKFATGENAAQWIKDRKSLLGKDAAPKVYPVHINIKKLKDFGSETNLNDFISQNGRISNEELLNEAMRQDGIDPSVLEEAAPESKEYKQVESQVNQWEKKYDKDPVFRGKQNSWIMQQPGSTFGFEDAETNPMDEAAQELGSSAKDALRKAGFDGIQYKNEVEGGHAVIPIGEHLNEQIRSAPAAAAAKKAAFNNDYVYHATDQSRAPMIRNAGIGKKLPGKTVGGWFADTPEEALTSGAVGINGKKDLRVFAVPRAEVEAARINPDEADMGSRMTKFMQSGKVHMPSHEIVLDENGVPTGDVVPLRGDVSSRISTYDNERFNTMNEADKAHILEQYKAAKTLTPEEIQIAKDLREFYDEQMDNAHGMGMIRQAVQNYHPQAWASEQPSILKRLFGKPVEPQDNPALASLKHQTDNGAFDTNVAAAKKRAYETEFQGEMAGQKPRTSDLTHHAANYQYQLEKAIAARNFLDAMRDNKVTSSDGISPLVAMSGSTKVLGGEEPAMLINPKSARSIQISDKFMQAMEQQDSQRLKEMIANGKIKELPGNYTRLDPKSGEIIPRKAFAWDTTGYQSIDHPSMRDWTYAGQDTAGNPAFMKAEMRVHPEAAEYIRRVIGADRSALRDNAVTNAILETSKEGKGLLLSVSPFHAMQLGMRSLMLGMIPDMKPVDFSDALIQKGIRNNLKFSDYSAEDKFNEGVGAHSKIIDGIPGLKQMQKHLNEFTFEKLMPSLKAQGFKAKYYDLLERMPGASSDEVARQAAQYINDTFGGQNWRELGLSATSQDAFRAAALAPDWLTSEIRSLYRLTGGMGKEAGQMARADMLKFSAGMYVTARVLNLLATGKTHPEAPFGIVKPGKNGESDKVYSMRTLPGDLMHAISSPHDFIAGRMNPLTLRPAQEFISGRDSMGRKVDPSTEIGDMAKNIVPIASQTKLKQLLGQSTDLSNPDQVLKGLGASVYKYRTEAENLAMRKSSDHMPDGPVDPDKLAAHTRNIRLEDGLRNGEITKNQIMRQLPRREAETIIKQSAMTPLQARFERLPLKDALDVFELATPTEKDQLHKQLWMKRINYMKRIPPAQRSQDPTWVKMTKVYPDLER